MSGSRGIIAGAEYSIEGMREGGYRRVRVSTPLAYGEKAVSGRIPSKRSLICEIWLHTVQKKDSRFSSGARRLSRRCGWPCHIGFR